MFLLLDSNARGSRRMTSKPTPSRAWLPPIIMCLALFGVGLLALSSLPFGVLRAAMRFIGIVLLIGIVPLTVGRRHVERGVSEMVASFSRFFNTLGCSVREGLRSDDRTHRHTLVLIVVVAIALRLCFLFQPIRFDESATFIHFASRPLYQGLSAYTPNNHLFHTFQVHVAYLLLGNKPWALRLPAFLAGVLVVPAAYAAVRVLCNKHAALLTAALVATSSALIEFSTLARGYSLQWLIFLLLAVLCVYLKRNREPAAWLVFSGLSALGFYTIPTMLFPFGILVVWLLLSVIFRQTEVDRSRLIKDLIFFSVLAGVLTLILYAPVLLVSGWKSIVANKRVMPNAWPVFTANLVPSFGRVWSQWNRDVPTIVRLVLLIGFLASLVYRKRLAAYRLLLVLAVPIWCASVLLARRFTPHTRVWLYLLPLYFGFASAGLVGLLSALEARFRRYESVVYTLPALALSVWLGLNVLLTQSVYYSRQTGTLRDAKGITAFLEDYLQPGDRVLARCPSTAPLEYHFRAQGVPRGHLSLDLSSSRRIVVVVNTSTDQTLATLLDQAGLSEANLGNPKMIREYESATLYEMRGPGGGDDG